MGKNVNECIVKVGERNYKIVENTDIGKGVKVYSLEGKPLMSSGKVFWWDLEGITAMIERNMILIEERLGLVQTPV